MLYIENIENNSIFLDGYDGNEIELKVMSRNARNVKKHFVIDYVSSPNIVAYTLGGDSIKIEYEPREVTDNAFIILKNTLGETMRLTIVPKLFYSMEKTFKFKISSYKELEDGSIRLKLLSKVNDMEIGWKITYDGKPMTYIISPMESDKGDYVTIKPNATIVNDFTSVIIFKQDESDEEIRFEILNTPNGIMRKRVEK